MVLNLRASKLKTSDRIGCFISTLDEPNCFCAAVPSSPRNVQALPLSVSAIQVRWQPPEDPNGGIMKYIIEYQPVGQGSPHLWVDTADGNKTTKDVTALNGSTLYQFRVSAFSKVPGEWSKFVQAMTQGDGE